jgi:Pretoxin HINT domain
MIAPILLCLGMMGACSGGDPVASAENRSADLLDYQKARKEAGRDPKAHVRLALWCESHGLGAERLKHLATAVLYDPANGLARGLMGLVAYQGKWARPDEVSRQVKADEAMMARLAEYNARRERMANTAEAHWKLALWCEGTGLRAEATAHLATVTQLDPGRDGAWKRLGFKKVNGRWVTEARLAAEKAQARAQKQADEHWKPLLKRWSGWLTGKDKVRKQEAETALAGVTDPGAVREIWSVFAAGGVDVLQAKAVQVLAQIDAPTSSRAVAMLAVFGRSGEVRRAATEVLRRRDPRDFLGLLVGLVRDRLKYEVRPGATPNSPGQLFVEGERYNVNREYRIDRPTYDIISRLPPRYFDSSVPFDPYGTQNMALAFRGGLWGTQPGVIPGTFGSVTIHGQTGTANLPPQLAAKAGGQSSQQAAINRDVSNIQSLAAREDILIAQQIMAAHQVIDLSRQQLRDDIQAIESYNSDVFAVNNRVLPVLTDLTGRDLGPSAQAWQSWWTDQRGYAYSAPDPETKPTYTEFVQNPFVIEHHSCFGAGTSVQTLDGPRAIESIRVGDQLLSQDARTGKLAFTSVMAVYHNKPAATLRIMLGDVPIVATGIHRFWKAGLGWTMARDLKPGDTLRVLGGTARVAAVEKDAAQPVFNLEVAEGQSFFVSGLGALVHDNSLVEPVSNPFDAVLPTAVSGH